MSSTADEFIAMKMLVRYKQLRKEDPNKPQPDIGWMLELLDVAREQQSNNHGVEMTNTTYPKLRANDTIFQLPDGRLALVEKYTRDVHTDTDVTSRTVTMAVKSYVHYQCITSPFDFGVLDIPVGTEMPQRYRLVPIEGTNAKSLAQQDDDFAWVCMANGAFNNALIRKEQVVDIVCSLSAIAQIRRMADTKYCARHIITKGHHFGALLVFQLSTNL